MTSTNVSTRNLVLKSNDFAHPHKQNGNNTTITSTNDYFILKSTGYTANAWGGISWNLSISEIKAGEQFSVLMPVYIDSSINLDSAFSFNIKNHSKNLAAYVYNIPSNKKDEWFNVAVTFKATRDVTFEGYPFYVYLVKNGLVRIKPPILVRGSLIPSDYQPAPEDFGWSTATLVPTQSQRYLWKFDYIYYSDGSVEVTNAVNLSIAGTDGVAGKDGVGLKSTLVTYGISTSETTQPSGWSTQVPTLTKGNYLWTKTTWTYTDNTTETGYQKTYIAKDGNNGKDGIAGKDGVGIKTTTITYASSTSGTTKPSSGWSATIPSVSAGNYLWTKTVWTYTDNTSETGYSVAKMGESQYTHFAYCNITKLCNESGSFTLQAKSTVRYGFGDKWVYKTLEAGTYTANNTFFGRDPYSGKVKQCELISSFSLTDATGRNWLGMYSDNNSDGVADPSYFTWQLTKGATGATGPQGIQGIQGPKGDQGIQGPKGADGKTQYTHIAYANNATGGGFSQTDQTKAYIGMYVDFTATDSNDPTKYRWSKWHGDKGATGAQGIQGPKGDDGRTPYLHIAYANSADGRTDFSTSNTDNKRYLGTYTDYTQADSTDPTKYKWVDMVGSVEVGGKNLLLYTADPWKAPNDYYQSYGATKTDEILNGSVVYKTHTIWSRLAMNWGKQLIDKPDVKVGDKYTYSVYVRTDQESPIKARLFFRYSGQSGAEDMTGEKLITQEWQRFTKTFTVTKKMLSDSSKLSWVGFEQTSNSEDGKFVYYACNMLEEGNIPTPWSPALEDVQSDIDSKADSALTQQQLNALAEQNSIVKAEMEAKASIDTVNQWVTAYQNYVNANDEARAESEKNLQEAAARILQLKTDVGTLKQQWNFIDTYMTIQNEGLIIGKSDGSAYAKFSNDRISLFSGNSEVMYISQGVLRIENGIFTKTIQIGRFRFETHPADQDILILRYLGG